MVQGLGLCVWILAFIVYDVGSRVQGGVLLSCLLFSVSVEPHHYGGTSPIRNAHPPRNPLGS